MHSLHQAEAQKVENKNDFLKVIIQNFDLIFVLSPEKAMCIDFLKIA